MGYKKHNDFDNDGDEREIGMPHFALDAFAGKARLERHLKLGEHIADTEALLRNLKNELYEEFSLASERILSRLEQFAFEYHPKPLVERYSPACYQPPIYPFSPERSSEALTYTSLSRYFTNKSEATNTYLLFEKWKVEAEQWEQFHLLAYLVKPKQENLLVQKVMQKIKEQGITLNLNRATVGTPPDGVIFFPSVLFSLYAQIDWSNREEKNEELALCNLPLTGDYLTFAEVKCFEERYPKVFPSNEERLRIKQLITSLAEKSII
ncbi:MAG: hypothetical protein HYS80_02675 [Candidatus Aenigmarchaeota archaeon]|nr:hypothetical protein [Candidatus Aenigmarchaeota archaeon]